jgi:5-methylcytosine-specific restriction endonuclease McrA
VPHATPEARAAYNRAYREKHRARLAQQKKTYRASLDREAQAAYMKQWYEKHKDLHYANHMAWRRANREHVRQRNAAWRKANPDGHRLAQAARRAKVSTGDFTLTEWRSLLEEFDHRCAYCQGQGDLEVEHMVPLSHGGPHTKDNIVPACGPCNRRKRTHTIFEFLTG